MSDIQIVPEAQIRQMHCVGMLGTNNLQCIGATYGGGILTTTDVYINYVAGYDPPYTGAIVVDNNAGGTPSPAANVIFPVGSVVWDSVTSAIVGQVTASTATTITIGGGTLSPLANNSRLNRKTTIVMDVASSGSAAGAGKEITVGMNICESGAATGATFVPGTTVKSITYNSDSTVVEMNYAATAAVSGKTFYFSKPIILLGISMINHDPGQVRSLRIYSENDGVKATVAATRALFNHSLAGGGRADDGGTSLDYGWAHQSNVWLPGGLFLTYPKFIAEHGNDGDDTGDNDDILYVTFFYQNQDNSKTGDSIAPFPDGY